MNKIKTKDKTFKLKDKKYDIEIEVKFSETINATSKEAAKRIAKDNFYRDYGIDLSAKEFKSIIKR